MLQVGVTKPGYRCLEEKPYLTVMLYWFARPAVPTHRGSTFRRLTVGMEVSVGWCLTLACG